MAGHPVHLVVTDDLRRSRLTILFRLLLALPHFVWLALWTIAAYLVALVNLVAVFVLGRAPGALHRFLAAYIRYATHVLAYLTLAANPYPAFTGASGYPLDVDIGPPEPQSRWVSAFRPLLALPALLISLVFVGLIAGSYSRSNGEAAVNTQAGIIWTVAFLGWFACLVLGRMPQGFRNLQAYSLRYLSQVAAYVFALTDRYPDTDPSEPRSSGPVHPVRLPVTDDLRRSRLTVFFRLLLSLPHLVWLTLWSVAALLAAVATWFSALVVGRPPRPLHRFLSAYVRYSFHVGAYLALTANPFPDFTGAPGRYPVDVELPAPGRQRRLVTLFRLPLAIPAFLVSGALDLLLFVAAFLGWFAALATGRMPLSLREAQAYALRYGAQAEAYLFLVTDRYAYSGPTFAEESKEPLGEAAQPV